MSKHHSFIDTVDQIVSDGVKKGILHLSADNQSLSGNALKIKDNEAINFGSCSYLGLEFDRRLINGSKDAVENYGTQFSASRAYISSKHYSELENLLKILFGGYAVVCPTTTLGHIAAIPVLVGDKDAVILDHQVHNSVQTAAGLLKPRGIHVELLRHNRIDLLEERIKLLRQKYDKIWYMADGIYSMYGDASPVSEIHALMDKYPQFHFYVDDAHSMSCYGTHGRGYVLSQISIHEQMVFATSLNKGFAAGGGVLVFPNRELARKVRTCGGPLITSGPMQPGALGAAIACAKIHLSDEIYSLQEDLHENIKFTNLMLKKYKLPLVAETDSPVFFVGVSLPKMGYNMVKRMLDEGYYLNLGIFPAVPIKNTGIRFTITRLHTFQQIENMIAAMAKHFPLAMAEEGISMQQIYQAFKLQSPEELEVEKAVRSLIHQSELKLEHYKSIKNIAAEEWNNLLGNRGAFDAQALLFLESSFTDNELKHDNWEFDYFIIRDRYNSPVLATFLTTAIYKDDMLSPSAVSMQIEELRKKEGLYHLTSKVLSLGSLLTEGDHLYLDRTSPVWKDAMQLLFEKMADLQEKYQANSVMLRDFNSEDEEMDTFLIDNGYFKVMMPENHVIKNMEWQTKEEFVQQQSSRSRRHLREDVVRHEDKYEVVILDKPNVEEMAYLYQLYLNVKEHSLALNTFTLPYKVFENIVFNENWEILALKLKPEFDERKERKPVAVVFAYLTKAAYNPVIVGLDYNYQSNYMCYRQTIYRVILRAKELGLNTINLGFGATVEKRKYGPEISMPAAYMQVKDNYNMEVIGTINVAKAVHN